MHTTLIMQALVRKSSFSKAQGLRETGSCYTNGVELWWKVGRLMEGNEKLPQAAGRC